MGSRAWKINQSKLDRGWLVVIGPFDEEFVAAIKSRIRGRRWDPKLKAWKVREAEREELERIIEEHRDPPAPRRIAPHYVNICLRHR